MRQRPPYLVSVPILLLCMYAPIGWIAFSSRSWGERLKGELLVFFLTLPGEWFAQPCGARAADYYVCAGLVTAGLFIGGAWVSRKSWLALAWTCCVLVGWSAFTANWLWHDLGPNPFWR